jgi:hypothetical protein
MATQKSSAQIGLSLETKARRGPKAGCQPAKQQTASLRYVVAPIVNRLYRRLAVGGFVTWLVSEIATATANASSSVADTAVDQLDLTLSGLRQNEVVRDNQDGQSLLVELLE